MMTPLFATSCRVFSDAAVTGSAVPPTEKKPSPPCVTTISANLVAGMAA